MLQLLARLLIRGPDADAIRADLETLAARDLERGMAPVRVRWRYATNLLASAASTWRARVPRPGRPQVSWLDFKLGLRMLRRHPGLTVVGGLALAYAIAVGAGAFEVVRQLVDPTLPLADGERIVALQNRDVTTGGVDARALHEFAVWREELDAVEELGAWREIERNLVLGGNVIGPARVAEISASAFRLAAVQPQLGRVLGAADERPDAPPVVLLGHDLWQARFAGDAEIVGRTIGLGTAQATVVGVMPPGFAFPVSHGLWVPLRLNVLEHARGESPPVRIFGRLAPGVTLERAQAELAALGMRTAATYPDTHEHLRPEVVPYAASVVTLDVPPRLRPLFYAINVVFVLLLLLVCANVALLMYARTATRAVEIVVRTALGASRGRIILQLFVEALVLGLVAAAAGLFAAGVAVRAWLNVGEVEWAGAVPFWFDDRLSPITMIYAVLLTVLGATVTGVLPALRLTGRAGERRLRQLAGGGGAPGFGMVWTFVIIAQVSVTVAFPSTSFFARQYVLGAQSADVGFPSHEHLSARIELDEGPAGRDLPWAYAELERRLEAEPGVLGVTHADRLPRTHHPAGPIEVEGVAAADLRVSGATVAPDFFDVLGVERLAGRGFHSGDAAPGATTVIVNRAFVARVLGGGNAVGRRLRVPAQADAEPGPWLEIVGVVPDMGMIDDVSGGAGLYRAARPGTAGALHIMVHTRGAPDAFAARLREAGTAVGPELRLHDVLSLDAVGRAMWTETAFLFRLLVAVSAIALLLALAGIYAVTSYAVSRRSREIGIRVALGAEPGRIVAAIFTRPVAHVTLGVVAGALLTGAQARAFAQDAPDAARIAAYAALMLAVCLLACVVPTWRALRVEPGAVLKAEP